MSDVAYLLRHGDYDYSYERLTPKGIEQAKAARDELVARELGGRAYLLSSDYPRAMQTAEIISKGLETSVFSSPYLRKGSLRAEAVRCLGEFLKQSFIDSTGQEADPGNPFVVVCHAPLVGAFVDSDDVEKGRVYPVSMDAVNPDYKEYLEEFVFR